MNRNYIDATQWAADRLENSLDGFEFGKGDATVADVAIRFGVGARLLHPINILAEPYLDISQEFGDFLSAIAMRDYEFFDALSSVCFTTVSAGHPVPFALRPFVGLLILGSVKRPNPSHRERNRDFIEDFTVYHAVRDASKVYNLHITRNDEQFTSKSACDAVAEALTACGVATSYRKVKDLMVGSSKARRRIECDAALELFDLAESAKEVPLHHYECSGFSAATGALSRREELSVAARRVILLTLGRIGKR